MPMINDHGQNSYFNSSIQGM